MANGFDRRVTVAATHISKGHPSTRHFDSCFENFDGDAVALALYLRTLKRPDTKLAKNIWKYLDKNSVPSLMDEYHHRTLKELRQLSDEIKEIKTAHPAQ